MQKAHPIATVIHMGTMAINPHLYGRLGYDPLADFTPITQVTTVPLVLVVHSSVPAGSFAELVRLAKAQPGKLNFGSAGIGTPGHLGAELFKHTAGIDAVHVPHKGGAQAVATLLAGQTTLAVTGAARLKSLPDVPTVVEAGAPDLEFVAWTGLAVPAGTPKPIVERLYREIRDLMKTPAASEWLELIGSYPRTDAPGDFARSIRAEHARLGKIIRDAGIRIE